MSKHYETGLSAITSLIGITSLTSIFETGWNGHAGRRCENREQHKSEVPMVQIQATLLLYFRYPPTPYFQLPRFSLLLLSFLKSLTIDL
jgi:hypothetical protein